MYKIIKIPFGNKLNLNISKKSKYNISGTAYYFIDNTGMVFHQYALLNYNCTYKSITSVNNFIIKIMHKILF